MKKIFFVSCAFPFVIYPGSGPEFGEAYGWEVRTLDELSATECDVALVENRLCQSDLVLLDRFLSAPNGPRFPVFFKISDPWMPCSRNKEVRYIFAKRDAPGVHYATVYQPAGPAAEFFASLTVSCVVRTPYPYEKRREVDRPMTDRQRRVFLSGARRRKLYPFRETLFRRFSFNPVARRTLARLPHPGYSITGNLCHDVIREKFVAYAARFTHFFLDPSRYGVELMKYLECAYAGSVPIGAIPESMASIVAACFARSDCRTLQLLSAVRMPVDELEAMAREYRHAMRSARDPARLNEALDDEIRQLLRL